MEIEYFFINTEGELADGQIVEEKKGVWAMETREFARKIAQKYVELGEIPQIFAVEGIGFKGQVGQLHHFKKVKINRLVESHYTGEKSNG